jgi:hypothetical protein
VPIYKKEEKISRLEAQLNEFKLHHTQKDAVNPTNGKMFI